MRVLCQRSNNDLYLFYSKIFMYSLRQLYLLTFRPKSSNLSMKSQVFAFSHIYTPALKKWEVYWFTSVRGSVLPSVRPSVRNSVTLFRQRYLHNRLTSYLVYRSTTTSCIVGLQMGLLLFVLPFVCSFFFLSKIFVTDISTIVKDRNFIFGIQVHNDKLYGGIENGPSPICSSFYLFLFLSLQIFRKGYLHNHLR